MSKLETSNKIKITKEMLTLIFQGFGNDLGTQYGVFDTSKEEAIQKMEEQIKKQILSALKLQELVKEKINQERPKFDGLVSEETYKDLQRQYHSTTLTLESLVKESEK